MAATGYFPPALATPRDKSRGDPDCWPLHREAKIAGLRRPPLALRPSAMLRVLARAARRLNDRHEGRDGRGRSGKDLIP